MTETTKATFNVCRFFSNGTHEYTVIGAPPDVAVRESVAIIQSPEATTGVVTRVIITDSRNVISFEWTFKGGITYPSPTRTRAETRAGPPAN